jgi:hypothetical protein
MPRSRTGPSSKNAVVPTQPSPRAPVRRSAGATERGDEPMKSNTLKLVKSTDMRPVGRKANKNYRKFLAVRSLVLRHPKHIQGSYDYGPASRRVCCCPGSSSPLERDNAWLHVTAHRAAVESPEPLAASVENKLGEIRHFPRSPAR